VQAVMVITWSRSAGYSYAMVPDLPPAVEGMLNGATAVWATLEDEE
jgi:hypothetical protein